MYIRINRAFMPYVYRPLRYGYLIGEPAAAVAACPGYQSGEVKKSKTEAGHLSADVVEEPERLLIGDFGVNWRHLKRATKNDPLLRQWLQKFENEDSYRLRILGYSDCIGKEKNNRLLRLGRAERVYKLLGHKTRSRVVTKRAAPKNTYITGNTTAEERATNRGVVIEFYQDLNIESEVISARECKAPRQAQSLDDYVFLVRCVEQAFPTYTPRQILSLLRQIYYGSESWSKRTDSHWKEIITCGVKLSSPVSALGKLLKALHDSQEVEDTDLGHVFTGLEAMCCPRSQVTFHKYHIPILAETPNVELATWAGDLAAAVGMKVFEEYDQGMPVQDWEKYLLAPGTRAGTADFNGDIDAYAIGASLSGKCAEVSKTAITKIDTPISKLLYDYYINSNTPLSQMRLQRIGCFIQGIGAELWGVVIKNKPTLYDALTHRVSSFARIYYTELRRSKQGLVQSLVNAYPSGLGTKIWSNTHEAVTQFVYWIEGQI
jgi:outer membrane protein OmpA-like peptidoglycan-associated protein